VFVNPSTPRPEGVGLLRVDPEWRFPGAAEWVNWLMPRLKPQRSRGQLPEVLELSAENLLLGRR